MNILIIANVYFPVNMGNYMGGIETICGETFKYINEKSSHKAFLAVSSDSDITCFESQVFRHNCKSAYQMTLDIADELKNHPEKIKYKTVLDKQGEEIKVPIKRRAIFKYNQSEFINWIKENKIDIILHEAPRLSFLTPSLFELNIPIIHIVHQGIYAFFEYHLYKNLESKFASTPVKNRILAVSNAVKNSVNEKIPNFITGVLNPSLLEVNKEVKEKDFDFTIIGRIMNTYKTNEIIKSVISCNKKIRVVGTLQNTNQKYTDEFLNLVKSNPSLVEWTGQLTRDEVLNVLGKSKYYITSIADEAYGITVLEALSMGCKVIGVGSLKNSGITDFILPDDLINIDCSLNEIEKISRVINNLGSYEPVNYSYYRNKFNTQTYLNNLISIASEML